MKVHTFKSNIRLIRLFSLMLNYAKPRMYIKDTTLMCIVLILYQINQI